MNIESLLTLIKSADNCTVEQPAGIPVVSPPHVLPDDLKQFFSLCGGVSLWYPSAYGVRIVGPDELIPANPVIVGNLCPDDITATWYIIAHDPDQNYLTIDMSQERLGRCYDSFFDRHGIVGDCPIVARSFLDLLERLWRNRGKYWYWLEKEFESIGDAYD